MGVSDLKNKVKWFFNNFEEVFGAIFLTSTIIFLFIQVIFRYVVGKSLPWTEELSRFAFLGLVYIGTSLAAKNRSHIRVTAQFKILPVKLQNFMIMLADLIWVIFNCVVIWQGILLYQSMNQYPLISPVLDWNLKYLFLIIPTCFGLQIFRILQGYYLWIKVGAKDKLIVEEGEGVESVT
ncbi:MAG: hypothetical protein PWP31_2022 [Clostridia bacterium]|nr:hypothetical protein [Clostridia bacterium]